MKKLLLLTLAVVFILAFSACNTNTVSQSAIENGEQIQSEISQIVSEQKGEQSTQIQSQTSSVQNQTASKPEAKISRDKAISIALNKAGFGKNEVRELEAELDYERKVLVWEVDFEKGYTDYSYDINAETGEIIRSQTEYD